MDSEIEELESQLSDYFGRTPCQTPCGSQEEPANQDIVLDDDDDEDGSDGEMDRVTIQTIVDDRVTDFLDQIEVNGSADGGSDDADENRGETIEVDEDRVKIERFIETGCGCHHDCSKALSVDKAFDHILLVREMTKEERDMYIMGSIISSHSEETTRRGKKRKRTRVKYNYYGANVCKSTFMLLFDVGKCALSNIRAHLQQSGPVHRRHKNSGRKPKHALAFDDIKRVVEFIQNYADSHGMPQPAAPRGRDNLPAIYLESSTTKVNIHVSYRQLCQEISCRAVGQTSFCDIWNNCLPHVKIATPRDDVCATCERHRNSIKEAVTENEKLGALSAFQDHVTMAQKERDLYNDCIKKAKQTHQQLPIERFNHYTFDYSQNVSVPHFSRQMGPIYFASLRKVQIFGVRIDGQPTQMNFLIDEHETIGKDGTQTHGPNAVISMVDHVLNTCGQDEMALSLHADNCPGQNKNRFMIGYLMWRVMTGKQDSIEYLMQVPGHAKCLVDSGFGHLKKLYRKTDVESITQLERVVELSAASNVAVRYPAWQWRDWKSYLKPLFNAIPGIRKYQYFRVCREEPGIVTMRSGADQPVVKTNILARGHVRGIPTGLPTRLEAAGLTRERSMYLYKKVIPYLSAQYKDITCPMPEN